MKKILDIFVFILLIATVALPIAGNVNTVGSPWVIEIVDSQGDVGREPSMVFDSNGYPHISYYDNSNGDLKYASWNGLEWDSQTVNSTGDVGEYSSLALDANDYPHISYFDRTNGDLKYAGWNGLEWDSQTVDFTNDSAYVGEYSALALDANDYPHISYFHSGFVDDLKYARWNGSAWDIQTVDSIGDVGYATSLALDANDYPHISYHDFSNGDLKYASWNGLEWDSQTVDSTDDVGEYSALALDANDYPHIGYYDHSNYDLKYARWNGSEWDIKIMVSATPGIDFIGPCFSFVLDANDFPHISYHYYDHNYGYLKYAVWNGLEWDSQTVDSSSDWQIGWYSSLALDANDYPHIGYFDTTNDDLKYAYMGAELEIGDITGGLGARSTIMNIGPVEAENVVWEIKFNGGIIFSPPGGIVTGGPINIPTTSDISITGIPIGFGGFIIPLNITVSANADNANPVSKTFPAKLLLFIVII